MRPRSVTWQTAGSTSNTRGGADLEGRRPIRRSPNSNDHAGVESGADPCARYSIAAPEKPEPKPEAKEAAKDCEKKEERKDKKKPDAVEVRIDTAGIEDRVVEIPVPSANLGSLGAIRDRFFYIAGPSRGLREGEVYPRGTSGPPNELRA